MTLPRLLTGWPSVLEPVSHGISPTALRNTLVDTNVFLVLYALEIAAEPNRRRLLHLLASSEQAVGELAAHFTVSRSAVSQHLLLLEQAGLVAARKEGRNRYYRLAPGGMGRLCELVEQFWTDELDLLASDAAKLSAQRQEPMQHHMTEPDNFASRLRTSP